MGADIGKLFVIFGIILVVIGLVLSFKLQIPWLGKLPGDISIKRDNFHFYFPLATSILISILLTAIFYFFRK